MEIKIDDLSGPGVEKFLYEHIEDMKSVSPPESKHALDIEGLRKPEVTFWTIWDRGNIIGCGALKRLDDSHAELKSMRVSSALRGNGIASRLLSHIIGSATTKGYSTLSLETGSTSFFEPAHKLYEKYGFKVCTPFSDYKEDVNSVFMSLNLNA